MKYGKGKGGLRNERSVALLELCHQLGLEAGWSRLAGRFSTGACTLLLLLGAVVLHVLAEALKEHEEIGGALPHVALGVDLEVVEHLLQPGLDVSDRLVDLI